MVLPIQAQSVPLLHSIGAQTVQEEDGMNRR